jgi:hypothetical protein
MVAEEAVEVGIVAAAVEAPEVIGVLAAVVEIAAGTAK